MEKTTQQHLLEDILVGEHRTFFQNGYRARDGLFMPCTVQDGYYNGIPYFMIGKKYNQGKRDSLCFARSFLYHFNNRSAAIRTIFNPELFDYLGNYFIAHGLEEVDYLVGMDADTVFADDCIVEMVKAIRRDPKVVGVCGHVCVDFDNKPFGFWGLYQSVEYSLTQGLRRMFQSRITGKVNCLPGTLFPCPELYSLSYVISLGCCQLIRVHEATFGDEVLREKFGYIPKPNDTITHHIMGNYSEDSIHASIIFSVHPGKRTAQALRAKAFTVVPQDWGVFLSQRKRWSLGSISNEFVMIFRPGIILVERLQSIITTITWGIMPFIIAAFAELIMIISRKGADVWNDKIFVGLISVLFLRYVSASQFLSPSKSRLDPTQAFCHLSSPIPSKHTIK
jgi:chitin synthase